MWRQLRGAAGYHAIFIAPTLLIVGIWIGAPILAFGILMGVLPLLRPIFGAVTKEEVLWRESVATALEELPLAYAVLLPIVIALALHDLSLHGAGPPMNAVGLGLSLWITLLFSTCVSHELIHRRNAVDSIAGHCLAGLAGYPVLAQEHLAHHARSGDTGCADWPRLDESMWRFAFRRARRIFDDAYAPLSAFWNIRASGRSLAGLRVATALFAVTAASFVWVAGWGGLVLYFSAVFGVWFGVQLINYVQHWGLGDDHLGQRALHGYGWEDDCRMQAWITLSLSLHYAHHQQSRLPFYRVCLRTDSPRLPAGYVVLMIVCLFPRLWFRLMRPALDHWKQHPGDPRSPGRRITCFALSEPRARTLNR